MLPIKPVQQPLYVIAVITNPSRYRSRYHLYRKFEKYVEDSGAILITGEVAYGDREFEITDPNNPRHFRFRNTHEIWHKENLINVLVSRLPHDWKYMAWIDADIQFARPDWVEETIHQLQHFHVVQMFSHALDLSKDHTPMQTYEGFVSQYYKNDYKAPKAFGVYGVWHPGYAWAMRRDAWDALGGLIDWGILGSGDFYMACALIGELEKSLDGQFHHHCPVYVEWCREWQRKAETHIRRNVGVVEGMIMHYFHGSKKNRFYNSRSTMIWQNKFDPSVDIKKDWQGMWQLTEGKIRLRDQLRAYFRSRNEDGSEP